jgi:hypothetical protein
LASLLPAGWAMCRPALEARAALPAARCGACCVVGRWRRPPNKQTERPVVRTRFRALGQGVRIDRTKKRSPGGVNHGDDHLGAARRIEHDPIEFRAAVDYFHKFTYACRLHTMSLGDGETRQRATTGHRQLGTPAVADRLATRRPRARWWRRTEHKSAAGVV